MAPFLSIICQGLPLPPPPLIFMAKDNAQSAFYCLLHSWAGPGSKVSQSGLMSIATLLVSHY